MFGPRLFRSRWAALFWAAGILWTAYDVAGSTPPPVKTAQAKPAAPVDALGDAIDPAALAVLANAAP